jgi:hypothetical protein
MKLSLVATAILALSSTIGMAQTSATINQRKDYQQDRIAHCRRDPQPRVPRSLHQS